MESEIEILPPPVPVVEPEMIRVLARANPFSDKVDDFKVQTGATLLDMLEIALEGDPSRIRHYHCWLIDDEMNGDPVMVPRERWHVVRPKSGITVTFRAVPHGGGGSKGALGIVLRVAVVALSAIVTWGVASPAGLALGAAWGAVAGGVVPLAGRLSIAGTIPQTKGSYA